MKKEGLLIFILFFSLLSFSLLYAQDENADTETNNLDTGVEEQQTEILPEAGETGEIGQEEIDEIKTPEILEDVEDEFEDAELKESSGITPDSSFYFVEDAILSRFRDDSTNREKKIAEIKAMVEDGNIDAAKEALNRYERYADNSQKNVDPEKREETLRSAVAISRTINEIRDDIPEEERKQFINILEQEGEIATATEIASKIQELCMTLSKLDPLEYSRVCKTEEDAPRWQKDMNRKLTTEQEQEAKDFFDIMSQCFKTSGRECKCEDISVSSFSEKCSTIAPLAAACDEGDETACEKMEEIEREEPIEDLLPEHLQDVLSKAEGKYDEDRYGLHMPPECLEAGVKTPKECAKIMFKLYAPEECQKALEEGRINPTNEKESREACDKIMFETNAPPECIEAGARDPKECGKIMFKINAPPECVEAGLTGENRGDDKRCRELMEQQRGREGEQRRVQGGFGGGNCQGIQDPMERLKCYDSASQGAVQNYEEFREERREMMPPEEREEFRPPQEFQQPPEGFQPQEGFQQPPEGFIPPEISSEQQPPTEPTPSESSSEPSSSESGGGETSSSGEGATSSGGEGGTTTGAVINEFYNYYFR